MRNYFSASLERPLEKDQSMTVVHPQTLKNVYGYLCAQLSEFETLSIALDGKRQKALSSLVKERKKMKSELEDSLRESIENCEMFEGLDIQQDAAHIVESNAELEKRYNTAISEYTTNSTVRDLLQRHASQLSGAGQSSLELISAFEARS